LLIKDNKARRSVPSYKKKPFLFRVIEPEDMSDEEAPVQEGIVSRTWQYFFPPRETPLGCEVGSMKDNPHEKVRWCAS
jgi:hypothetical protein